MVLLSDRASQRLAPTLTLKEAIQTHIAGEIQFSAHIQDSLSSVWNSPTRYQEVEHRFTITFHISYVALRPNPDRSDPRKLRQSYSLIKPIDGPLDELCYHDAQISLLVTGTDGWHWAAYCFVDTFFGGEQSAEEYLVRRQDGPSGGVRDNTDPCRDPREYFLLILSRRFVQISIEWGNFFTVLMSRLDAYASI
jgi:hypothetical protein